VHAFPLGRHFRHAVAIEAVRALEIRLSALLETGLTRPRRMADYRLQAWMIWKTGAHPIESIAPGHNRRHATSLVRPP